MRCPHCKKKIEEDVVTESRYYTPKNLKGYGGEFIVFFTEKPNPRVLFHSVIAKEAYDKATEIMEKTKRLPVVQRVGKFDVYHRI